MQRLLSKRWWFLLHGAGVVGGMATLGWKWKTQTDGLTCSQKLRQCQRLRARCVSSSGSVSDAIYHQTPALQSTQPKNEELRSAIEKSSLLLKQTMLERGIPGAVVAVAKDGKIVWSQGFGYADVENGVLCTPDTVMRIASISKPLTAVALLQLWQKGKLDLDAPVQTYVPDFPHKTFENKPVEITTKQLLSHLAGIRHYEKRQKNGT